MAENTNSVKIPRIIMNEAKSSQWQRLSIIIDKSKHTTNSFAKSLGLDKSERIYRIKRGQNGISRKLAELIHKFYPEYSVPWILCGSNLVPPPTDILEIPLFDTIEELLSGKTVQKFIISQSVAPTTRYALRYKNEDPDIPEYRQDTILLLRRIKPESMTRKGLYYIISQQYEGICSVIDNYTDIFVRYKRSMPYNPEIIVSHFTAIKRVWYICGTVTRHRE